MTILNLCLASIKSAGSLLHRKFKCTRQEVLTQVASDAHLMHHPALAPGERACVLKSYSHAVTEIVICSYQEQQSVLSRGCQSMSDP